MKKTLKNLKKVYVYGKEFKKNLIILVFMSLLLIVVNIITPTIAANQIVYLTENLYAQLIFLSLIVFGLDVVTALISLIMRKNVQIFFRGTTKNIQLAAAKEILKIKVYDIDRCTSGTFIQRIGNDTSGMSLIFTRGMSFLTFILTDIGIFVAIFIINKLVFVFYLLSSILLGIIDYFKAKKVNAKDKKYRIQKEKTNGIVGELVRGVRDIKMLHAKKSFLASIEDNINELNKSNLDMMNTDIEYNFRLSLLDAVIQISLIILLSYLLFNSYITVATALILFNYRYRVLHNLIYNIGNLLMEIEDFNLSSDRVFSLLGNKEFKKETFGKEHIDEIKGNLEFQNVHFSYDDNKVLKGLSFKIKENETVAFVGKSGVGKTTIFSLLCKLYDINEGKILIDGKDIQNLDEFSIRNNITIISQNPYIFNMSIKDNLRLVKEGLTIEEMQEACKLACLHEFIESLPLKYDTVVGEGGVTLSGGQRQRLAIARAFVQNTKIILFDEATSALDNETQKYIQTAINNMKDRYTILIIAHRLSTIVGADRIMLVEDGKITDTGSHKELLARNKNYKKLYDSDVLQK